MKALKRIWSFILVAALAITLIPSVPAGAASRQGVTQHSKEEIALYLNSCGVSSQNMAGRYITMSAENATTAPYTTLGRVSDQTKQDFLNVINAVRYVAGLDSNVSWDENYYPLVQAASVIGAVNTEFSHTPPKPAGMDNSVYEKGAEGAGSSNIWKGTNFKGYSIYNMIIGYMDDKEDYNISRLGHRRWILNPDLGASALGYATVGNVSSSAMYAFDRSNSSASQKNIAWPATYMPTDFFSADTPWSVSTGSAETGNVRVTLTRQNDNKKWEFYKGTKDGYFNVENTNYGLKGCVIFRPDKLDRIEAGDKFTVKITGLLQGDMDYTVEFFNAGDYAGSLEAEYNELSAKFETPVYRYYNHNAGDHKYSLSRISAAELVRTGYVHEKNTFGSVDPSDPDAVPVYELFDAGRGEHIYTTQADAYVEYTTKLGYKGGGVVFYAYGKDSDKGTALYRIYNPNAKYTTQHAYTSTYVNYRNFVEVVGWKDEGIVFRVLER